MSAARNTNYRKSGFLLAGVTAIIYAISFFQGNHQPYLVIIIAVLAILALLEAWPLPQAIDLLIGFGNFMHRFTNPLIFGLIYIVAVIPTSLVLKLTGKDILQQNFDSKKTSYWQSRTNSCDWNESFHKQY